MYQISGSWGCPVVGKEGGGLQFTLFQIANTCILLITGVLIIITYNSERNNRKYV